MYWNRKLQMLDNETSIPNIVRDVHLKCIFLATGSFAKNACLMIKNGELMILLRTSL